MASLYRDDFSVTRASIKKEMHRAAHYDSTLREGVSNGLIGMQIGAVWKMTMPSPSRSHPVLARHTNGTSGALSLPSTRPYTVARGRRHEKKNLS